MKILVLDIETAPNLAYVWGLWKQNITIDKIVNSGYVLCWSAKWLGEKEIMFDSIHKSGQSTMLRRIHRLLDEADAVMTYHGDSFDLPTLNKSFVTHKLRPPSPYRRIDLCTVVKRQFRFPSAKLDYVCKALGLETKVRHYGFDLWIDCMKSDKAAWKQMEKYNRQDVNILEQLYYRLRPWINSHPNYGVYRDASVCPNCGSEKVQRRGVERLRVRVYPRLQCQDCGKWFRGANCLKQHREERYV